MAASIPAVRAWGAKRGPGSRNLAFCWLFAGFCLVYEPRTALEWYWKLWRVVDKPAAVAAYIMQLEYSLFFLRAVGLAHITITRASQHAAPRLCGAPGAAVNQGKRRRAASGVQPKLVTGQIHSTVITRNKHRYPRGHHIDRMRCGCQAQALL